MSLLTILIVLALAAGLGYGALHYMTGVPGKSHIGPLPPLTAEETELAASLERHVATIAAREHNLAHYEELDKGCPLHRSDAALVRLCRRTPGIPRPRASSVRNIDVVIEPPAAYIRP